MNEILQHPVIFWTCLLTLVGSSPRPKNTEHDKFGAGFRGLAAILWGSVFSLILPRLILEIRLGHSPSILLNSGFPLFFMIILSFAFEYLAALPSLAFCIFSVISFIAAPDLFQPGLFLGGLSSHLSTELGFLIIILPLAIGISLGKPALIPESFRTGAGILFLGILPAFILAFNDRRSSPGFFAAISGALLIVGTSLIPGTTQVMTISIGVGGFLAITRVESGFRKHRNSDGLFQSDRAL